MRAIISTPTGSRKTNGSTLQIVAVMKALASASRPLCIEEVSAGMDAACVMTRNGDWKGEVRAILQRLFGIGAVYHPNVPRSSRLYCLSKNVRVEVTF